MQDDLKHLISSAWDLEKQIINRSLEREKSKNDLINYIIVMYNVSHISGEPDGVKTKHQIIYRGSDPIGSPELWDIFQEELM